MCFLIGLIGWPAVAFLVLLAIKYPDTREHDYSQG
jgi:hypothetical protein